MSAETPSSVPPGVESHSGDQLASAPPAASQPQSGASRAEIWQHRLLTALVVIFFIEIGMILVVVPWTPVWTDNKLLLMHPSARAFVMNGFTRGVASGLGLINVWIGIWEAVHFNDKV